jgi:hypothetical protein
MSSMSRETGRLGMKISKTRIRNGRSEHANTSPKDLYWRDVA